MGGGNIIKICKNRVVTAERISCNAYNGDIVFNSAKSVNFSAKGNIIFREYDPKKIKPPRSIEFKIKVKPVGEQTFVPFGIPSFQGKEENQHISFEVEVLKKGVDSIKKEILHNGKVIRSHTFDGPFSVGKHNFDWDGFDDNGVYDSTIFTTGKLQAKVTGTLNGKIGEHMSEEFSFGYKEVQWVDVKIDKNTKRIDVTLRVNLKDGGARGVECKEVIHKDHLNPGMRTSKKVCPWDKIPETDINKYGKPPLKERTKSFEDLKQLALEGINKYWSGNKIE